MKRNFISVLRICLLTVVFLFCFSACDDTVKTVIRVETNNNGELIVYYSDDTFENLGVIEKNADNPEIPLIQDGLCQDGMHDFEFGYYNEIYPDENVKEIFVCKKCGVTVERPHEHTYGKAMQNSYGGWNHERECYTCGARKWEHHSFCDENGMKITEYTVNGFDYTMSCADCGLTKTVNALTLKEVEHGKIEVIATSPKTVIKAIPDEGYYFEKFKVTHKIYHSCSSILWDHPTESEYDYSLPIVSAYCGFNGDAFLSYEYEPVFTDVNPFPKDVSEIKVNAICDTGREIDVDYAFSAFESGISISYYIPEDDAVLVKCTHVSLGNVLNLTEKYTLPCVGGCLLFNNSVTEVNFYFVDTTEKHVGTASTDMWKPDILFISDETGLITFERGGFVLQELNKVKDNEVGYYVEYWTDLNGEIVSKEKVFTTRITQDTEYHAVMKKADVLYKDATEIYYLFSDNDEGLTLEGIYKLNQIGEIKVPETVNGKAVTEIGDYAFLTLFTNGRRDYPYSIEIPESIKTISENAFYGLNDIVNITVKGDRDFTFQAFTKQEFPKYFGGALKALNQADFNVTENTLKNMVNNLVATFVDTELEIEFVDKDHLGENVLGHYESGSKKICILENEGYSFLTLYTIAHEIRHFYQEIAIGNVSGLSQEDLLVKPTDDQIGAWKYLEYTGMLGNYEEYYYNAREIDAREYAKKIIGIIDLPL